MAQPHRQRRRRLSRTSVIAVVSLGAAVALEVGLIKGGILLYRTYRHLHLLPILIVLLIALAASFAPLPILVWPLAKGLVNEHSGRLKQARQCYRRAISRYLRGGLPLHRNFSRIGGFLLFIWKYWLLDLQPEEARTMLADVRNALKQVRNPFSGRSGSDHELVRDALEILTYVETVEALQTGRIGYLEAALDTGVPDNLRPDSADPDDPDTYIRGLAMYELGLYQDALESCDRAARAYEASGDTELRDAARLLGAMAAWEIGDDDLADCERRLGEMWPADLDTRLGAIGLECQLASVRGTPEKAVAILERIASRVPGTSVDADMLAWLASVRATALRTLGRYDDALLYARQAVDHLQRLGPLQALDSRLELAFALDGLGDRNRAVEVAAGSAAELDARRYQLGHMGNRLTFARVNEKARALALELAAMGAPQLAAEVVECARVQGLPSVTGDDLLTRAVNLVPPGPLANPRARGVFTVSFAADDGSLSAAGTAAGLTPLTPPPRLDLFEPGDSILGRLAPELVWNGEVVLAQVAEAVAGQDWWWWGSWAAGGQLYWSLIGHDGTVEAGGIPVASLKPALTRLARALPTLLEGETGGNVVRAKSGPLAQPDTAVALANELGELLIPRTLKDLVLARAASGQPLSLVVAPAPELGRVPFGLLGLGKAGVHLAHGAVVRLGASAALLDQIRRREPGRLDRQVLAVIDPCDDAPLLAKNGLNQAGVTGWAWLQDRPLLSRHDHLRELSDAMHLAKEATADELSEALRTTDAGVFAYIGHVWNTSDDVTANASLVLNGGMLAAHQLLYDPDRKWPMPARVALIGCGSGGAHAPEWLGLAPASLWAGAQIVAATAWDLIDEADTWRLADEVVSVLLYPDPATEWRERFIHHLAAWKSHTDPSPLSWGAVQFVGLGPR
jgi:tetratricopeptide (TPR) repeat protein